MPDQTTEDAVMVLPPSSLCGGRVDRYQRARVRIFEDPCTNAATCHPARGSQ